LLINIPSTLCNTSTKKKCHLPKTRHVKYMHHRAFKFNKHSFIIPCEYKIINIKIYDQNFTSCLVFYEQGMFIVTSFKSLLHKIRLYTAIPSSWSLLESI
jgi:hypothetical protein